MLVRPFPGRLCSRATGRESDKLHLSHRCAFEELCNLGQEQQAAALLDEAECV